MKEYKIARGWAILIYIAAPALIALFVFILLMPFIPGMKGDIRSEAYWLLAPLSIGMIALVILGLVDTIKSKFVIDENEIYLVSVFSNRHLMLNEIRGYRVGDKYIIVESNIGNKKNIKISTYISRKNEIIEWLASRYPDLDILNSEQEKQEILANEEFGWTEEERMEKLNKARKTTKVLNWAGGLIAAWTIFWPTPYEYAIIASILLSLISIAILKYFKGLIRIDEKKDSAYPSIFVAIFASGIGLCLRALLDYNIFNFRNIWTPAILISVILLAFLFIGNKEFKLKQAKDYFTIVGIALITSGYGYGSVVILNCLYDRSTPEIYKAKILHKRISSGKTTTYYFELTSWGQQKIADEVSVPKKLYNTLEINDEVNIYLKEGQFKIPWFIVTE